MIKKEVEKLCRLLNLTDEAKIAILKTVCKCVLMSTICSGVWREAEELDMIKND